MDLPRTPSFRLDGRRAVVTGAGRGIGLALASALAEAGAQVTLVARTATEIEAAATAMNGDWAVLDVADIAAVADFFANRPAFDILVNNAGTNRPKPMTDVSEADYDAVLDLNVKSAFFVAQGMRPPDDRGGQGRQPDPYRQPDGPCRRPRPEPLLRLEMGAGGNEQGLRARPCRAMASGRTRSRRPSSRRC